MLLAVYTRQGVPELLAAGEPRVRLFRGDRLLRAAADAANSFALRLGRQSWRPRAHLPGVQVAEVHVPGRGLLARLRPH